MNDELQKQLATILGQIASGVKAAGDFTLTQLPDVAQQYVAYGRAYTTISLVACAVIIALLLYLGRWAYKNPWKGEFGEERGISNVAVMCVSGLASFFMFCFFMKGLGIFIMVWFAPKVWLIREIAGLLK